MSQQRQQLQTVLVSMLQPAMNLEAHHAVSIVFEPPKRVLHGHQRGLRPARLVGLRRLDQPITHHPLQVGGDRTKNGANLPQVLPAVHAGAQHVRHIFTASSGIAKLSLHTHLPFLTALVWASYTLAIKWELGRKYSADAVNGSFEA